MFHPVMLDQMSFSAQSAGLGKHVGPDIKKQLENTKQYSKDSTHVELTDNVANVVTDLAGRYPEHVMTVNTSGHTDPGQGNVKLEITVHRTIMAEDTTNS